MAHVFDPGIVSGVLSHMNNDHADDNLLIARAFSSPDAIAATMTGFDGGAGAWRVTAASGEEEEVRVPWPGGPISERPEVRREIVALYDAACLALGQTPRPHA
ncbi:DUF2470 domain-containing protein [Microbacterium lacus]|uniref:DUF2470 domain-containing protein n=1 Tax=Microbacterium lacus TaxID=415217 RepID=UPI00384EF0FD